MLVRFEAGLVDCERSLHAYRREWAECKTVLSLIEGPDGMIEPQLCPVLRADLPMVLRLHLTRAYCFYHYDKEKKNYFIIILS